MVFFVQKGNSHASCGVKGSAWCREAHPTQLWLFWGGAESAGSEATSHGEKSSVWAGLEVNFSQVQSQAVTTHSLSLPQQNRQTRQTYQRPDLSV